MGRVWMLQRAAVFGKREEAVCITAADDKAKDAGLGRALGKMGQGHSGIYMQIIARF